MKLSIKATMITCALFWAGWILVVGLINRFVPTYGWTFLKVVSSLYPGYHGVYGLKDLAVGVAYGLVDGAIGGLIIAWIYNMVLSCGCCGCKKDEEEASE